jgi:hypothetical protein
LEADLTFQHVILTLVPTTACFRTLEHGKEA